MIPEVLFGDGSGQTPSYLQPPTQSGACNLLQDISTPSQAILRFSGRDAVPSPNATWPSVGGPNTLDSMIDDLERVSGTGLALGGSKFKDFNTDEDRTKAAKHCGGIVAGGWGTGALGLVLPRSSVRFIFQGLTHKIKNLTSELIAKQVTGVDI